MSTIPDTLHEAIQNPASIPANVGPQLEKFVRENPTTALLAAVGIGCAVGILSRALLHSTPPPPPRSRAIQVLEDIQSRLSELIEPAYNKANQAYSKASDLAEDGTSAVKKGIDTLSDLHIGRRLKSMFN